MLASVRLLRSSLRRNRAFTLLMAVAGFWPVAAQRSADAPARMPVVLDFDIGGDIDDAFALALLLQSRAVDLRAVTTVTGDTHARARIAAKMMSLAGRAQVPVAAGPVTPGKSFAQARWAEDFHSPALVDKPAVDVLHATLRQGHGNTVLIALGPLSNIAALLERYPADRSVIKQIVLMGGSLAHGYYPGSGATAESNIATDPAAAQLVFRSGVPLLVAPLDATAALQMDAAQRAELFARHTPLTDALQQLYTLWGQATPTLHDPLAVTLLLNPSVSKTEPLDVTVTQDGMTRMETGGKPNAEVAVRTDAAAFLQYYERSLR